MDRLKSTGGDRHQRGDLEIAKGTITRYAKLDRFMIVTDRPETCVGKIDKKRLRAQFGVACSPSAPMAQI
ncbi:hypothetical protein [Sphingosinicella sp.]|uniref:hypothetical protein n=1 Tax=Sphingosinicella sp. TaxID=1917971 RepID=UPI0018445418|nr:hypothetical protein [Sphingosinicella sp.]MBA4759988.1 hypothetical protein [Sphingosinicella sp.]